MKLPKIKKYQIIDIDWYDSLHSSGWLKESQAIVDKGLLHKSVGYFLRKDKNAVLIIQSRRYSDNPDVDGFMQIPLVSIIKISLK